MLLWLLPIRLLVSYPGYAGESALRVVFLDVLLGLDNRHLWFLPCFFLDFCVVRLCQVALVRAGRQGCLCLVLCVLGVAGEAAYLLTPIVSHLPYVGPACQWSLYYAVGYAIHVHGVGSKAMRGGVRVSAASLFVLVDILGYLGFLSRGFESVLASLILVLCLWLLAPREVSGPVRSVSKDSMGLYLFHSPLLYISYAIWANLNPALMVLVNLVGFGCIAALITHILRRGGLVFVLGE